MKYSRKIQARLFPIAHEVGMMLSKSFDAKEAVSESLFFAVE